ncbi:MAG: hypothetical protein AAB358_00590 [Patescibacteria group bacterium]
MRWLQNYIFSKSVFFGCGFVGLAQKDFHRSYGYDSNLFAGPPRLARKILNL